MKKGLTTMAERNNNFNLLRLTFAFLVILAHGPELLDGDRHRELLTRVFGTASFGDVAVDGFFLLSGFLIVKSWERKPELKDYFEKRIRRIYPGFIVAILLSAFFFAPLGVANVRTYFSEINYLGLLLTTLTLHLPNLPSMFVGRPYALINGALWSIAYEFYCYAIVALLGLLGATRQRWIWLALAVVGLAGLPWLNLVNNSSFAGHHSVANFMRLITFFAVGACFCLFKKNIPLKTNWAAVAALALVPLLYFPMLEALARATLGAYAVFCFAFTPIANLRVFQRMSDISYGIYLYGWPIQKVLDWYFPGAPLWGLVAATLVLACGFGLASWKLIESPMLRRAQVARHVAGDLAKGQA
ncbi:acyltransferase family protein [Hymenobacter sp. HMF4947]|uniref:Acyltransferase family protein n=1 Tax=Hymenobacter ginkgonis TaxID=2682976 RepID=A0A7K1TG76_9BACT|nr:acyltransferase [Hymenobacter ginkgonis]MVN77379.1 acyltransferase family protein [Hymenobacter ginkgonis]